MNLRNRLTQLEKQSPPEVSKYLCVYYEDETKKDPRGYKVQPSGTNAGEPFYLPTLQELDAFGARPGVDLARVVVKYASSTTQNTDTQQEL